MCVCVHAWKLPFTSIDEVLYVCELSHGQIAYVSVSDCVRGDSLEMSVPSTTYPFLCLE